MAENFPAPPNEEDVQRQAADIARGVVEGLNSSDTSSSPDSISEALDPVREELRETPTPKQTTPKRL